MLKPTHYAGLSNDELRRLIEYSPVHQMAALDTLLDRLPADDDPDAEEEYDRGSEAGYSDAVDNIIERCNDASAEAIRGKTDDDIVRAVLLGVEAREALAEALHAAGMPEQTDPQELIDWIASLNTREA